MELTPAIPSVPLLHCSDCNAECCKHIAIPIDAPVSSADFAAIKWYIAHDNVIVYRDIEGDWLVEFQSKCGQLDGNRCKVWGTTSYPRICSEYDMSTCVMNEEGEYWDVMFRTAADVDVYIAQLGVLPEGQVLSYNNCVAVPIDEPTEWGDFDDMRWYLAHRDVRVIKVRDQWFVHLNVLCKVEHRKVVCPLRTGHIPRDDEGLILATWDDLERCARSMGIIPVPAISSVVGAAQ